MVFTQAQTTAFYTAADQMALPAATYARFATEGITTVDDLEELDAPTLKQIAQNLRSSRYIADPAAAAGPNAFIRAPGSELSAKSQKRITAAIKLVQYYTTTNRPLTAANVRWSHEIKTFVEHYDILESRSKAVQPEVPKITKDLPILYWAEAFHDWTRTAMGCRDIPLAYVLRPDDQVPAHALFPLATNMPYSTIHGSVEHELIARASHEHGAYREDNGMLYDALEIATRSTEYGQTLKPFQRTKDGRNAALALFAQHTGPDKWQKVLEEKQQFLYTRKWKATGSYSLEKFVAAHREAYNMLVQCADRISYQLPNEHTRVTLFISGIECSDPKLEAKIALVQNDNEPTGKAHNFEAAAAFILPADPVARRRLSQTTVAQISDTTGSAPAEQGPANKGPKIGRGKKTGVHLRWHTTEEHQALSRDEFKELQAHRDELEAAGKGRNLPVLPQHEKF